MATKERRLESREITTTKATVSGHVLEGQNYTPCLSALLGRPASRQYDEIVSVALVLWCFGERKLEQTRDDAANIAAIWPPPLL